MKKLPDYNEQVSHLPGSCYRCGEYAEHLQLYQNPGEENTDIKFWLCQDCYKKLNETDIVRRGGKCSRKGIDKPHIYPDYLKKRGPDYCVSCGCHNNMLQAYPIFWNDGAGSIRICPKCIKSFNQVEQNVKCKNCSVQRLFSFRSGRCTCPECGTRDEYLYDCLIQLREINKISIWYQRTIKMLI